MTKQDAEWCLEHIAPKIANRHALVKSESTGEYGVRLMDPEIQDGQLDIWFMDEMAHIAKVWSKVSLGMTLESFDQRIIDPARRNWAVLQEQNPQVTVNEP